MIILAALARGESASRNYEDRTSRPRNGAELLMCRSPFSAHVATMPEVAIIGAPKIVPADQITRETGRRELTQE